MSLVFSLIWPTLKIILTDAVLSYFTGGDTDQQPVSIGFNKIQNPPPYSSLKAYGGRHQRNSRNAQIALYAIPAQDNLIITQSHAYPYQVCVCARSGPVLGQPIDKTVNTLGRRMHYIVDCIPLNAFQNRL